ncbi:conserved protein of unknown function [Petrocella atlantisensis]|uniref:Sugar-binding domain-containing protein n=1 Tax=Petrocella atlantisensis TaxID=2173034 RepID=A0A3P7PFI1_9FIRM|nr:sugar-binding transcriptional regulator [Petrocella atlantisensis]MCF8019714.1 sugar-binding transcriptional regulator [Vallitaleaceae bacterium]PKM56203.1 MAG: hypothetical protein CVV00_00745 [Firmicutes bacterium HGW-Firmicutes-5]VDN48793.1 conserved protein of unknown function [Petrocella atlantisensis]
MLDKEEYQLIIDASVLYYLEGKTQSEVAKTLYLSRPKVSRLLKKARELQIVDITINYQNDEFEKLQSEIRRTFDLPHVVITKTLSDKNDTLTEVGKAAAKELLMLLHDDMTLGISWGKHVRTTAKYLKKTAYDNMRIVELFGAISYDLDQTDMLSIGRSISSKLGGKLYPLPSPIYINDPIARKAIVETPLIKGTLNMIENCDLILTGIGSIYSNTLQTLWDNYVDNEMKSQIVKNGGIGFVLAHFFDQNGNFLDMEVNDNVIGIKTESIKNKKIIAVASGEKKAKAILGALRGGLIDTLVSDEATLNYVLQLNEKLK